MSDEDIPGWSAPFAPQALQTVQRMLPLEGITRDWAWGEGTGRGVKVAVIDSGVEAGHPAVGEVQGYMAVNEQFGEISYDDAPHEDLFGHGTACAGIIRSLAPECEIYSVRVLGGLLSGSGRQFSAGLRWAIENGMNVCNLSLTTAKKEFFGVLHELADQAYFRNCILVTSANNIQMRSFPAMYASVISVASHDIPDPELYYYNPAPPVEFGAHGIDVKVAWRKGTYTTTTGNSFATPHITGLIARILGKHPNLTSFQVKSILWALAANVEPGQEAAREAAAEAAAEAAEEASQEASKETA